MNRMTRWTLVAGLATLVATTPFVLAQTPEELENAARRDDPEARYEDEGFWPTRKQMELFFDRITDRMVELYELDDEQFKATREIVRETMPRFLTENKRQLKALLNEFIEAQLSPEPPDPNMIRNWASRAVPMIEKFDETVLGITDEMHEFLTEDQQLKLEAEHAAFRTGLSLVTGKLHHWSEGGFNPETDWPTDPDERRRKEREERVAARAEMQAARQAVLEGQPGAIPDGPADSQLAPGIASRPRLRDEWEMHVASFIRRYDLNDDQQQMANSMLLSKQQERDAYLQKKRADFDAISKRLSEAKTEEEKSKAREEFDALNRPVARMFTQLKDRLETIPTRKQRKDAARSSARSEQAAEPPQSRPAEQP